MNPPLLPIVFAPHFLPKPWGARRLADLLGKPLPPHAAIGESWELADLPEHQSRVAAGPLAGWTLTDLLAAWGTDLLGSAPRHDSRFPLLIKFLDAAADLSIQVHPCPAESRGTAPPAGEAPAMRPPPDPRVTGVKHEAWYVLHAEPGAKLYSGLRPGVGPRDLAAAVPHSPAANARGLLDLLMCWDVAPGQCFYLPSGTLHALGAGIVVAEVQTPSDVTYRLYDWGRVDTTGRPRALHIPQALANIRYDIPLETLAPRNCPDGVGVSPASRATPRLNSSPTPLLHCPAFEIHLHHAAAGDFTFAPGPMRVWILLSGTALLADALLATQQSLLPPPAPNAARITPGDVALLPAAGRFSIQTAGCTYLEVTVPGPTA